jgi:hypothetical protein
MCVVLVGGEGVVECACPVLYSAVQEKLTQEQRLLFSAARVWWFQSNDGPVARVGFLLNVPQFLLARQVVLIKGQYNLWPALVCVKWCRRRSHEKAEV